jgi:acetyl esterase/lipase
MGEGQKMEKTWPPATGYNVLDKTQRGGHLPMTTTHTNLHRPLILSLILTAALPASVLRADEPAKGTHEVKAVREIAYYEGDDADPVKHKLDLYLPRDVKDFPVLFFVHGGAWMHGDKNFLGIYSSLAHHLAKKGLGVVVTNYRLSPKVQHPEHIKDVARAFAWTYKHIADYGGNKAEIFVTGHSAGGHLVALLGTDDSYLKAHGLDLKAIKGDIPISGVMEIEKDFMPRVFGSDEKICKAASPIAHVRKDLPPFLVLYADDDLKVCSRTSIEFAKTLKEKKAPVEEKEIKKRNHMSILLNAVLDSDPVADAIVDFIGRNKGSK